MSKFYSSYFPYLVEDMNVICLLSLPLQNHKDGKKGGRKQRKEKQRRRKKKEEKKRDPLEEEEEELLTRSGVEVDGGSDVDEDEEVRKSMASCTFNFFRLSTWLFITSHYLISLTSSTDFCSFSNGQSVGLTEEWRQLILYHASFLRLQSFVGIERTAHRTVVPFLWLFMGLGLDLGLELDLGWGLGLGLGLG